LIAASRTIVGGLQTVSVEKKRHLSYFVTQFLDQEVHGGWRHSG